MIIKGKYLLCRKLKIEGKKPCFVHYVLINEDTSPSVARVKDYRETPIDFEPSSYVYVNSNILIDKDGRKHLFYTDIEDC